MNCEYNNPRCYNVTILVIKSFATLDFWICFYIHQNIKQWYTIRIKYITLNINVMVFRIFFKRFFLIWSISGFRTCDVIMPSIKKKEPYIKVILHQFWVKKMFPRKFNLEYDGTFTKLFMHVSSRNMFPTNRNLQIRVHVYRSRHYCGDWFKFRLFCSDDCRS